MALEQLLGAGDRRPASARQVTSRSPCIPTESPENVADVPGERSRDATTAPDTERHAPTPQVVTRWCSSSNGSAPNLPTDVPGTMAGLLISTMPRRVGDMGLLSE